MVEISTFLTPTHQRILMPLQSRLSRRDFFALSGTGAAMIASSGPIGRSISRAAATIPLAPSTKPIGIELYAVRGELAKDLPKTLKTVAEIGYKVVEFYSPYTSWTLPYAKDVRTQLDDLGLRCYSTHNSSTSLTPGDTMTNTLEDWKRVCGQLTTAVDALKPHGLFAGFHNHFIEWKPIDGNKRVMDVLAENTPKEFVLQFDVGTCLEAGMDPVAWIKANPGRIKSMHLKDWAPGTAAEQKGFRVLFGEGVGQWTQIIDAAESVGGVEFYLMEQEGSRYSEFDTAKRCLETWKAMKK